MNLIVVGSIFNTFGDGTFARLAKWPRAILLMFALVVLSASCNGGSGTPAAGDADAAGDQQRALTLDEAQRLATVRLINYTARVRAIEGSITDGNRSMVLRGWVDYTTHLGYATSIETDSAGANIGTSLLTWDLDSVAGLPMAAAGWPPLPIPSGNWTTAELGASDTYVSSALRVLVRLGADTAENPQLLSQSGARWIRSDTIRGQRVDVMSGPTGTSQPSDLTASPPGAPERLRYWVNDAGELLRLEINLGATPASTPWSVIDLADADAIDLEGPLAPAP